MPGELNGKDQADTNNAITDDKDTWSAEEYLCFQIVSALDVFDMLKRHYVPNMPHLRESLAPIEKNIVSLDKALDSIPPSGQFADVRAIIKQAAAICVEAFRLCAVGHGPDESFLNFRKAERKINRLQELIYPLCRIIRTVNLRFLEPQLHVHAGRFAADTGRSDDTGIIHVGLDEHPYARGGFSFYVPESYDARGELPVVVALHGGFGHGRDYMWHWLREARTRRFLLAAPSSRGTTWSIMGADVDASLINEMLGYITGRWNIDTGRILLTGMSDGATYALKIAMSESVPFSAFAVLSCVLPPYDLRHVRGRRIYWVHGARDWMFPVLYAKNGSARLAEAKADVTLKIVPDLYHAHPSEENEGILTWFDSSLAI